MNLRPLKLFSLRCLAVFSLVMTCSFHSSAETVNDLRYGVTLYHFFQQSYFDALTEVMVAEEQNALPNHLRNAQLLKGGMSLSYGLDQSAQQIFNELLVPTAIEEIDSQASSIQAQSQTSEAQKARAWFYLGKMLYQRGSLSRAQQAFDHIDKGLLAAVTLDDSSLYDELLYLKAVIAIKRGELASISNSDQVSLDSNYWPYFTFNLAAEYLARGDWDSALAQFKKFDAFYPVQVEDQALKDRAHTAEGFAYLKRDDYLLAVQAFEKISPDSLLVDKALLGYGWAQLKRKNYHQVLGPWQALRQHSLLRPSVREVYLALPYVYEQLDGKAAALNEYKQAVTAYQQEIVNLEKAIAAFNTNNIAALFSSDAGVNSDGAHAQVSDEWLYSDEMLPVNSQADYLSHLIAQHDFQTAVKNYRDVLVLFKSLNHAQKKIKVLKGVSNEQQRAWVQLLEQGNYERYQSAKVQLSQQLLTFKQRLDEAEQDSSGRSLSSESSRELWSLISESENLIASLSSINESTDAESEMLSRFKGLLLWQDSEQYFNNLWALKKDYRALEQQFNDAEIALANVDVAVKQKNESQFTPRIANIEQRVADKQQLASNRLSSLELNIRKLAVAELNRQKQQLIAYLSQAKLSIARLYDSSTGEALE